MKQPPTVACPRCGKPVVWSAESPFRPFCSERCKQIDLGAWATERYCVPGEALEDTLASPPPTPAED